MSLRIGIYFGVFDPMHDEHVAFIGQASQQNQIEKVFVMPEQRPRSYQGVRALQHRRMMIERAIPAQANSGLILAEESGRGYDIWRHMCARFPGYDVVCLATNNPVTRLQSWFAVSPSDALQPDWIFGLPHDRHTAARESIATLLTTTGREVTYRLTDHTNPDNQSLHIRQSLRRTIRPAGLNDEVYEYIVRHRLYISGAA